MLRTTMGQLLINEALPPDLRDYRRTLDKKSIRALLRQVSEQHPEKYNEIVTALMKIGAEVSTVFGGEASISLDDLRIGKEARSIRTALKRAVQTILGRRDLTPEQKDMKIQQIVGRHAQKLRNINFKEQLARRNALAMQVHSGARGNATQFSAVNVGDLLVQDHRDQIIPVPILNSYAEGLDPVEYWAGSYGARKGTADAKFATPKGGFLGKQLALAAHRLIVSEDDCGTTNGIPVEGNDPDNEGAVLAQPAAGVKAGTILDTKQLKRLRRTKEIIVRSPLTCQAKGGVCAKCAGVREKGKLPEIGENIGIAAAQAISEPVAQSALSSKHCLAAGTLVRMADYTVCPIEDIRKGDMVLGADHTGATFPVRVTNTYNNGKRDCLATTLQLNQSHVRVVLESTADHKVLMRRHIWDGRAARRGGVGTFVWQYGVRPIGAHARFPQLILPRSFSAHGLKHEPRALLLGLLLGNGCYTKSVHGVHLSCADKSLVSELRDYLAGLNLRLKPLKGHKIYYRVSSIAEAAAAHDTTTGRILPGARNPAVCMLQEFGAYEKQAHEKTIPDAAFGWDNESVAELLAGLFITDGSVYLGGCGKYLHIAFGATSKKMVEQTRELLAWRFGIYCAMSTNNYGGRKRPMYYIRIANAEAVRRFIDTIPLRGVKRAKVARWRDKLRQLACQNINRLIVKSQRSVGAKQTYDIEVDHPDHLFVLANGAIVSNSGGIVGAGPTAAGFDAINQLVQVPKTYKGGATIATVDGRVDSVEKAPQGGTFVSVAGERHYIAPGFAVKVKKGDTIEAGDVLSEGLPNPAELVRYKGIGAGRWHFMKTFRDTLKASKIAASRRNIELLARGVINHARITDEDGPPDTLPDDIVEFDTITRGYTPRPGFRRLAPRQSIGRYLEEPILQYSIGTRITPRVASDMAKRGYRRVSVHKEEPSFAPEMVRAMETLGHSEDWMVRLGGFHLKKNLLESVHRGRGATERGPSYIPALARGVEFGQMPTGTGAGR